MLIDDLDLVHDSKQTGPAQNRSLRGLLRLPGRREASRRPRLHSRELRTTAASLATLLEGGVPILRSLEILVSEATPKSAGSEVLKRLMERIRQGSSLSEALAHEPESFPSFYSQMVQAGEISGKLPDILRTLATHLEKEEDRRRRLIEAAAYPSLVMALGFLTFCVLLKFVIPKIAGVYGDFGGELPFLTRAAILSGRLLVPGMAAAAILFGGAVWFLKRQRKSLAGYALRLPMLGNLLRQSVLCRFTSLLALELESGIPMLPALESVRGTLGLDFFQKDMRVLQEALSHGGSMTQTLRAFSWVPPSSCALIQAGQESGRLPQALGHIYRETSLSLDSRIHFFLKILEPLLILAVGGMVGLIVLSAILPILEINTLVR